MADVCCIDPKSKGAVLRRSPIPVIDLFAGPGGLSEGFASFKGPDGTRRFSVRLSIEKDRVAHKTLELRALYRSFDGAVPEEYYDYLRGTLSRDELFSIRRFKESADAARREAQCLTLGPESRREVSSRVRSEIHGIDPWLLIGGPPCQAYSLAGRSRMRSVDPDSFEKDHRHFLYKEYLRIISEHLPTAFVMENVKGILSSTVSGGPIFERIMADLSSAGDGYKIYALAAPSATTGRPADYVVRAEELGVPQARHRVILLGVRKDICAVPVVLPRRKSTTVSDAISDLPRIRSQISRGVDSHKAWLDVLYEGIRSVERSGPRRYRDVVDVMERSIKFAERIGAIGAPFLAGARRNVSSGTSLREKLVDSRLSGICSHQSRSHMPTDLQRYFFASSFAVARGTSPRLSDFPAVLIPNHRNAERGINAGHFSDRFKVQLSSECSSTLVSHIAKDGHYYIHPDPAQCRSLTVREACRLQTFPDNYFFEGNRTQQYAQVGNAVPPMLAAQIAEVVADLLSSVQSEPTKRNLQR